MEAKHSYFSTTGFEMYGEDIFFKDGIGSFEEALVEAKQNIKCDGNKCAVIRKRKNTFRVVIRLVVEANPSACKLPHLDVTNLFYGRRTPLRSTRESFDYFIVDNLDMLGGDISVE